MKTYQINAWWILVCVLAILAVLAGTASGKVLKIPEDAASLETAVESVESGDTILVEKTDPAAENIRQTVSTQTPLTISILDTKGIGSGCEEKEDFEGFTEGTAITSQIPGVTFFVEGQSCDGSPTLYMRVLSSFDSTTFASKVLMIDQGCPDFSSDTAVMVFNKPQSEVSFDIGPGSGTYRIRVYNQEAGGTLIMARTISIPAGDLNVFRNVQLSRSPQDIRRIEISELVNNFKAIDNLTFGADRTPPEAEIQSPVPEQCVCGEVSVTGIACDDDGVYDRDRLEYRRVYPDPDEDWQLIREYVNSPVCTAGSLYSWDTTAPEIIDGVYQLRVTAVNDCGLTASDEITVRVDNTFSTVKIDGPKDIVGGDVCIYGTVWDLFCFEQYTAEYTSGLKWLPVNPDIKYYTTEVTNQTIATWVESASLPDGNYDIRITGQTECGSTDSVTQAITIDNTPPVAEIISPSSCTDPEGSITFKGTASDTNLYRWQLDRWAEPAGAWVSIASGTTSVVKGYLGVWNRGEGSECPDVIRLRVWDKSLVNPCSTFGHDRHMSEDYIVLKSGDGGICRGDYDEDGDVDGDDLSMFAGEFGGTCP